MGCGASKVIVQQPTLNSNVEDMKDLNGHAQQALKRSSIQSSEQDKQSVASLPKKQPQPVQEAHTVQQQDAEPVKPVREETSTEPKQDHDTVKQVQEEPKNDVAANEKPAPTYTEESLQEFLELENKLSSMESKGVVGQYQTQHKLLVSRYADLQVAHKKVEELKQQTAKEYRDVAAMYHPNVRAMFSDVYHLQSQMAKEQQEYMDALNKQEVAEKELKTQQEEYNVLYAEVQTLQKECEELQKLRAEREKKLDEIFDGKYGSDLEGQLEVETELLTERKEMITRTRNYWSNAKLLMEHSVKQLAYATRRWAQINSVSVSMVQARYSMVAETRNYLIAASQNVTNTLRYLSNVNVPYFTTEDLRVLNHAIARIFNDIMNHASFIQALQTYSSLNNKAYSLLQWISMVLEKTINKDLEKIVPLWQEKMMALKRERLRLIHVKIRELQGKDTSEDITDEMLLLERSEEEVPEVQSDTHIAQPDTISLKDENTEDVPPLLTTETTQDDRSSSEDKSDVVSKTKHSEDLPSESRDVNTKDVPPLLTTETTQDDRRSSEDKSDVVSKTKDSEDLPSESTDVSTDDVLPPTEGSRDNEMAPSSLTVNDVPTETEENTPVSSATGKDQNTSPDETDKEKSSKEIAELLETAMKVKPLIELAPVPDMDVLFGNIEELKTKYEEQVAQFSKAQEVNKARLDQALQDKLQARRIRKQAIELKDTSELAKGVTTSIGKLF